MSQGWDDEKVIEHIKALVSDFNKAEIEPLENAMLAYARKLTLAPSTVNQTDVDGLRRNGASDSAIHDLCAIVSYFNFVNRIADGLGVELESN